MKETKRLHGLDYLRGLCAVGIMIYHYLSVIGKLPAETFMGRVGVFGVEIFYVLSGLTLYHVYRNKISNLSSDSWKFARNRIFRIFPLLWLITLITIVLSKQVPDPTKLALNLTGLYGVLQWDKYFAMGAWSIGNELVFYILFPFLILFLKRSKVSFYVLAGVIGAIFFYFTFAVLTPSISLGRQWRDYVNPLNQALLFLGGILIGHVFERRTLTPRATIVLFTIGFAIFIFYPAAGYTSALVSGTTRLIFTASCFLICLAFYQFKATLPVQVHKPLAFLGEASYSVYLLHPLCMSIVSKINKLTFKVPYSFQILPAIILTLIVASLVYRYYEQYFVKLGKKTKSEPVNIPI